MTVPSARDTGKIYKTDLTANRFISAQFALTWTAKAVYSVSLPYSLYYKKVLYKFLRHFDASYSQDFRDFLIFKP